MKQGNIVLTAFLLGLGNVCFGIEQSSEECKDIYKRKLYNCCKPSDDVKSSDGMTKQETYKKCKDITLKNNTSAATLEEKLEHIECLQECFYNSSNYLTADMKINAEATKAGHIKELEYLGAKWKEAVEKSLDLCIKEIASSKIRNSAKCKSGSVNFTACFSRNLFLNCPDSSWDSTNAECRSAKETIVKCFKMNS